jgi:hypothetical protein
VSADTHRVNSDKSVVEEPFRSGLAHLSSRHIIGTFGKMDGQRAVPRAVGAGHRALEILLQLQRVGDSHTRHVHWKPVLKEFGPLIVVDYGGDATKQVLQGAEEQRLGKGK